MRYALVIRGFKAIPHASGDLSDVDVGTESTELSQYYSAHLG